MIFKLKNVLFAGIYFLLTSISIAQKPVYAPVKGDLETFEVNPIISKSASQKIPTRNFEKWSPTTLAGNLVHSFRHIDLRLNQKTTEKGSIWVEGTWAEDFARGRDPQELRNRFLQAALHKANHRLNVDDFSLKNETRDNQGWVHHRFQQIYQGIPLWGSEIVVHTKEKVSVLTGIITTRPTERIDMHNPIPASVASLTIDADLEKRGVHILSPSQKEASKILLEPDSKSLVIYPMENGFRLVWHVQAHPNLAHRWEYFVDAKTNQIIDNFESLCKLHGVDKENFLNGPSTGTGIDLHGETHTLNTWTTQGFHFLIDAAQSDMFNNSLSRMPDNPVGAIITLDALNTYPGADNFKYNDVVSNSESWNNAVAVSAHVNGLKAFQYFKNAFGRISINGQGGNIISLVNVVDEDGKNMDNAFWNGAAIFYGNGNDAFRAPLAKGLDVAAHELGHGVIQTTANLTYRGESGALNESFADIFGAMVDRSDWKIGEDVVDLNIFRNGALRSMSDPNNGGSKLGDPGWQPKFYNNRYTGEQDNGGVHINSGIPNYVFYLFATDVGKDIAESIYYNVLDNYLTKSSQFVDLRIAVLAESKARFGENSAVYNAAANAFNTAGIIGEQGGNYTEDVVENPGEDVILTVDDDRGAIRIIDPFSQFRWNPLSTNSPISRPSISDDGSTLVYVADDNMIRQGSFDWNTLGYGEFIPEPNDIWRNVAISKDGRKIAALTKFANNEVYIFSLDQGNFQIFEINNPTTAQDDTINTGDVLYADVIEWDHTGEYIMYDAFNRIEKAGTSSSITYWDIGFIQVWDEKKNDYGDGFITKLFSGLPERVSVGNPTFSKNSPYIIAFDLIDTTSGIPEHAILGVNFETGDLGLIYENSTLGWPNFSRMDDKIIFNAQSGFIFTEDVIAQIPLNENKISAPEVTPTILLGESRWGVWFSNGERELSTAVLDLFEPDQTVIYPNPVQDKVRIIADWIRGETARIEITNLTGQRMLSVDLKDAYLTYQYEIDLSSLVSGVYIIQISNQEKQEVLKLYKQ